ncbi:MAG: FAD-dependent oxidoreductase, partial [Deltaproteobacteria bacterium]|nr:FAD-dependent oxidoreductase [Deltaproteobacteria bacterium]
ASLAREAGYDGVEIMGSEGYLINQFIVKKTNRRNDEWGGTFKNRTRFPLEIIRGVRKKVGNDFILIYRLSMLDLVKDGSSWDEVVELAKRLEEAGVSMINTGIGWHEARIPTIATMVPRAGFTWVTKRLMGKVSIPLITTNRINMPEVAEKVLADGCGDMVSMARPFLADPYWVEKAQEGRAHEINTCIACNQACLDHIFLRQTASCLVNPRACRETIAPFVVTSNKKHVAVVGGGPAGLACATTAAARGHKVTLFEAAAEIGGQFRLARNIPGKEEFEETLRYYACQLEKHGVDVRMKCRAELSEVKDFDEIVVASGVRPRTIRIPGADNPICLSYSELISGKRQAGRRVAIIGAGGIGFDVATFLVHHQSTATELNQFMSQWGVDMSHSTPGGLKKAEFTISDRELYLLQRKSTKPGAGLGKTTGWIHRSALKKNGVKMLSGVEYLGITDEGLGIRHNNETSLLSVDTVVICAGQVSELGLADELKAGDVAHHIIGGASEAAELDAERAIFQGVTLADTL